MTPPVRNRFVLAAALAALPALAALSVAAGTLPNGVAARVTDRADFVDLGRVRPGDSIRVRVVLARQPENAAARALRLLGLSGRAPALSGAQYLAYFAPTPAHYALTLADLRRNGFAMAATAPSRSYVDAIAPAQAVERYFHTQIHHVLQQGAGVRYANSTIAIVPASLRGLVTRVEGLDTLAQIERPKPNAGSATYGDLTNFDTFNDENEVEHGFEIEIDGDTPADVLGTFPVNRYGAPTVTPFVHGRVHGIYVRYQSPYDRVHHVFTAGTPIPKSISPTAGHYCWPGGAGLAVYLASGCEHFGVALKRFPTKVRYHWMRENPRAPGTLIAVGPAVTIGAPSYGIAGGGAVNIAEGEPEDAAGPQFSDAVWVRVYATSSPKRAQLNHLVTDDPSVPGPKLKGSLQIAWGLIQNAPAGSPPGTSESEVQVPEVEGAGKSSMTLRYEYYKYSGLYNPEDHSVMCGGDGSCSAPQPGELGRYSGAQMGALNFR